VTNLGAGFSPILNPSDITLAAEAVAAPWQSIRDAIKPPYILSGKPPV